MTDLEPVAPAQPVMPAWEYAPAPESKDIVRLQDRYGLFIGGEFVEPKSGRWFPTIDPSNETVLAEVAEAGEEDVDVAVTAAARPLLEQRVPRRADAFGGRR
jgi:aldehyde dehydrogenase (NAD+)